VFCTKHDATGAIVRHKVKLLAKGHCQVAGVDFHETFALVAKFTTIQCISLLKASIHLKIHQMNVKAAFVNVELEEDIYMNHFEPIQSCVQAQEIIV